MSEDRPYGPQGIAFLMLILAAIGFGASPVFAKLLSSTGTPPEVTSFYRFVLTAVLMLPFISLRLPRIGATIMGILAGAALGLGWVGFVIVLEQTTLITAGALYLTYPLFAVVFAGLMLSRVPGVRASMAALLAIGAAVVALRPDQWQQLNFEVALLGLAAPFGFGFAIAVLAGWLHVLNPLERLGSVGLGACLGLLPLILLRHPPDILIPATSNLALVIGLGAGTGLIPSFLYVVFAPRLGAVRSAFACSPELPTMAFFGWWLFQEAPLEHELAAAGVAILGVLMIAVSRGPKGRAPAA